ncbi:MAG: 3-isopropylmalate dehydratase small subunit [Actinomycetota bacterium]|nr:3-isopropylmalate dehydratase small subunit [Acidimicrobiaceae bacterium]MEC7898537.1 3-isopropylmalate dehydratase small subunit [Actinomycetota bacterium]
MEPVEIVFGTALPLNRSDIDTDQIIPSDWLKRVERTGFDRGLFSEWRDDPSFVLNDERFTEATILVAGANFGTGSSREHAVWAIQQYGFKAVISPRFADIFRNNCTKNGLVPVQVSAEIGEELLRSVESNPELVITVDVSKRVLEVPDLNISCSFPLEDAVQERFLKGLDDIGITMKYESEIHEYQQQRPDWLPSISA